jgi:streptomycin 6-kinase
METFERNIVDLHGPAGAAWLADLPARIAALQARWGFTAGPPFDNLSYNYAAPVELRGGTPAGLKMSVPGDGALACEMAALRLYAGHGMVRLLHASTEEGAMLLERLRPGVMLATLADDEEATRIAAGLMLKLWRPAPAEHGFPTVAGWAAGLQKLRPMFGGGTGPLPAGLVDTAEHFFAELLASGQAPCLLHGDLHHFNILSAEREPWLAIDPKGLVGDPGYDVGPLLHNPFGEFLRAPDLGRRLARRVAILSEVLGMERQRVARWGAAVAVLSAWWSVEDHGAQDGAVLRCAELLSALA